MRNGKGEHLEIARTLRKNMTPQERHLWYDFLKKISVPVKRQAMIDKYIVDFYIPSAKLVIELDGSQHFEEPGLEKDKERDRTLRIMGLQVVRYMNPDIDDNFSGVCKDILNRIGISSGEVEPER